MAPRCEPDRAEGAPRWVKALVIVAAVLIALLVTAMLLLGGDHGPGRHAATSGNDAQAVAGR